MVSQEREKGAKPATATAGTASAEK